MGINNKEEYIEECLNSFRALDHEVVCRFATLYKTTMADICYDRKVSLGNMTDYFTTNLYKVKEVANMSESEAQA